MAQGDWLTLIKNAKKTAIISNGKRKVHYLMEDSREMVEEYNMETNVLTRRAWREKSQLGRDAGWRIEVGDPEPKSPTPDLIQESSNSPFITKRLTKSCLEWRIRNLTYPENVYSLTANGSFIIVKTSNKKFFKKIHVPDLERIGLEVQQNRLAFTHKYNTLIITYKKPPELLGLEDKVLQEVLKLQAKKEGDVQCPTS